MFERIQKLLDRIESRVALWTIVQGSGIVTGGAFTGWLASAEAWVDAYGRLGWWIATLAGALLTAFILMGFAGLRYLWIKTGVMQEWKKQVNSVNPLESDFKKLRLCFIDIASPINNDIGFKRFIDWELMGPANIVLSQEDLMNAVRFRDCDVVVMKYKAPVNNVIFIHNTLLTNCTVWKSTIFIPRGMVAEFARMNAPFVTFTGDQEIDTQSPSNTAPGTQPRSRPG